MCPRQRAAARQVVFGTSPLVWTALQYSAKSSPDMLRAPPAAAPAAAAGGKVTPPAAAAAVAYCPPAGNVGLQLQELSTVIFLGHYTAAVTTCTDDDDDDDDDDDNGCLRKFQNF